MQVRFSQVKWCLSVKPGLEFEPRHSDSRTHSLLTIVLSSVQMEGTLEGTQFSPLRNHFLGGPLATT